MEKTAPKQFQPKPVEALAQVSAYHVTAPPAPVDLRPDGNEGATPPGLLMDQLHGQLPDILRRYPDAKPLTAALADRFGLLPNRILVTAGADEALDRVCRAFLAPGREIVMPMPTFVMLPRYARLAGGTVVEVDWPMDQKYPADEVIARINEKTAIVCVVSPNNPSGAVATAEDLRRVAEAAPHAVVLADLAYSEFADEDLTAVALDYPNVVVTRTFSKAWGLAGCRVGYALSSPEMIEILRRAGNPYSVPRPSLTLAEAWLEIGGERVKQFVARIREEREELIALLERLGAQPIRGQGNFVLARFADARWVRDALSGLGIAVRLFEGEPGLEGCLRVTLPGDEGHFGRLTAALETAMAPDALLFDLDGVFANVAQSYRRAIIESGKQYGVTITREDIHRAKAAGNSNNDWDLTHRLIGQKGVEARLDEVTERFERLYQGTDETAGLHELESLIVPAEWIQGLARRFPLGIVTGRPRRDAERFLAENGIRDCFRAVITMDDVARLKPDPDPVNRALQQLGVSRAWMIGDTPDDMRSAKSAGCVPVGVIAPQDSIEEMKNPLHVAGAARVFGDLQEMERLLP